MTTTEGLPASATEAARPPGLAIDDVMPRFDTNVVQHIVVNAGPQETYRAVLDADLADNALSRLLVAARDLPNAVTRRRAGGPATGPADSGRGRATFRLRDAAGSDLGWVALREEPGVELLAGLVGQFWHRDYGIVRVTPEELARFDRPGYAKTVAGLSMHPHGTGRTVLTYESRTVTTDAAARRRFRAYWLVLRPFVRLVLRSALVSIKRQAEQGSTSRPTSSFAPLPRG